MKTKYLVVDSPFNRHWYPEIIGKRFTDPPGYASTQVLPPRVTYPFITIYRDIPRVYDHHANIHFCIHYSRNHAHTGICTITTLRHTHPQHTMIDITHLTMREIINRNYVRAPIIPTLKNIRQTGGHRYMNTSNNL